MLEGQLFISYLNLDLKFPKKKCIYMILKLDFVSSLRQIIKLNVVIYMCVCVHKRPQNLCDV